MAMFNQFLIAVNVQAAPKSSTRQCAVPVSQINVEGLTLGESKTDLLHRLPALRQSDDPKNTDFFSPDMAGLNFSNRIAFVTWISYDKRESIDGWRLAIGDQAKEQLDFNISPEKLQAELIQRYSLPKTGWQKHINKGEVFEYRYTCRDYSINIRQDYGEVQQGSGASFFRYASTTLISASLKGIKK